LRRLALLMAIVALVAVSVAAPAVGAGGRTYTAHLSGDEEVPPTGSAATGQAIFKLSKDGSELSYKLIVANIENVVAGHIHIAPTGINGPVVVNLFPNPATTNGVSAQGVTTSANLVGPLVGQSLSDLITLMEGENAYVNVHTTQFPGGEIRGQIK
jgi:hypothetical protein